MWKLFYQLKPMESSASRNSRNSRNSRQCWGSARSPAFPEQSNWGVYTIQQTSSKLPANVFKIRVLMLDVCWTV